MAEKDEILAGQGEDSNETTSDGAVSGVDNTAASSDYVNLAQEHVEELSASVIPGAVARAQSVYTAITGEELPEPVQWVTDCDGAFPALVYLMREVDGTETCQVKPANPINGSKYIGPSKRTGNPPQLPVVRLVDSADTVVLVEGCKQALALLAHAPADVAIARFTGVQSWKVEGAPSPHLATLVAGRKVLIVGDADAATNIMVFDGLSDLGEASLAVGADEVRYVRIPGKAKQGVDDVLAGLPDDEARATAVVEWFDSAVTRPADLTKAQQDRMRKAKRRKDAEKAIASGSDGRHDVVLTGDWHPDCIAVAGVASDVLGGRVLFRRGDDAVELVANDAGLRLRKVKDPDLHRQVLSAVRPIGTDREGAPKVLGGFGRDFVGVLRGHVAPKLPEITRVSTAPVVRSDGTLVTKSGYDPQTRVLVDLDPSIEGMSVPEHPSDDDIAAAVRLLRDDLFERDLENGYDGWAFAAEVDRTHALALLLTTVLRSGVPVAPLFLFNGLRSRVGKGELAQVVHVVAYGREARTSATPGSDAEMEKRISADLLAGLSMIVLDEVVGDDGACRLKSSSLNAALAGPVWGGRKLGVTESLSLRQDAVWVATGNNVDVPGDIAMRTVPIRLSSDRREVAERDNFRHNVRKWALDNRRQLLTAVLVLIRAYYDRGRPAAPQPFGFNGFNEWQEVVGGILHCAGIGGFLDGVLAMRVESDTEAIDNEAHLLWVESAVHKLPEAPVFTAKDVLLLAGMDPDAAAPYDREFDSLGGQALGLAWKRMAGRWFGDLRIVGDGLSATKTRKWRIERLSTAPSPTPAPAVATSAAHTVETMRVKGRDGRVTEHVRAMPPMDGMTIAEMGLSGGDRS